MQISDTKQTSQKPVTVQSGASGSSAGVKQTEKEPARKEKASDRKSEAQERIRAKLIAISEQSVDDVKRSQPSQSRDTRTSGGRARSPSPKRYAHVCVNEHVELLLIYVNVLNYIGKLSGK